MYVAIRDAVVMHGEYDSLLHGLRASGAEGVELEYFREHQVMALSDPKGQHSWALGTPGDAAGYREQLTQQELKCSTLLTEDDFGRPDFDSEIGWTVSAVRAAESLGVPVVRVGAIMSGQDSLTIDEAARRYAAAMSRVLHETADSSVALAIENHGYVGNNVNWLDKVLETVDSPRLGLTLDPGNFYWNGNPLEDVYDIVEHFAAYAKHLHCKNIAYPEDTRNRQRQAGWEYEKYVVPLAEGDLDYRRIVAILRKFGYDNDLCIEDESLIRHDAAAWQAIVPRDVEYLRAAIAD